MHFSHHFKRYHNQINLVRLLHFTKVKREQCQNRMHLFIFSAVRISTLHGQLVDLQLKNGHDEGEKRPPCIPWNHDCHELCSQMKFTRIHCQQFIKSIKCNNKLDFCIFGVSVSLSPAHSLSWLFVVPTKSRLQSININYSLIIHIGVVVVFVVVVLFLLSSGGKGLDVGLLCVLHNFSADCGDRVKFISEM